MAQAFLLGRIIVGGYYLFSAFHHFTSTRQMAAAVASHGVPMPVAAVIVAGVLLAVAGVTFLLGAAPRLGVAAVVLFFLPVTLIMHAFWNDHSAAARMNDMINFTKNVALLGSSLMFLAIPEPWPYSVGRRARFGVRVPA
jgi:putative oxidoreductase